MNKHEQAIVTTKENDDDLNNAKEKAKFLASPYKEQLKFNKIKARLVGILLEEKYSDSEISLVNMITKP